jgi:tol-pal system protein YbgF
MTRNLLAGSAAAFALAASAAGAFAQSDDQPVPPRPAAAAAGTPAPPPVQWDQKRLERLERNMRRIENELSRLKPDKAPPLLIEPDPEVTALQGRVDELSQHVQDLEAALKRVNGNLDSLGLAVETLKKDDDAAHAALEAMAARVSALEAQVKTLTPPPTPPPPTPGAAGETGSGGVDPAQAFQSAMRQMRDGDYQGASKAFEAYIAAWPDGADAPEAHYRLAETFLVGGDQKSAAVEYASALKGWPKTDWAPDATVKLAAALQSLGQGAETCAALGEFRKRYAGSAPATVKARAEALEGKAKCKAPPPPPKKAPARRRRRSD